MDDATKRRISRTYVCHFVIGVCAAVGGLIELRYGAPATSEELTRYQVVGMLVALPLALVSIGASLMAVILSFEMVSRWPHQRGLPILLLGLGAAGVAFAFEVAYPPPHRWVPVVVVAYVLLSAIVGVHWFAAGRKRS